MTDHWCCYHCEASGWKASGSVVTTSCYLTGHCLPTGKGKQVNLSVTQSLMLVHVSNLASISIYSPHHPIMCTRACTHTHTHTHTPSNNFGIYLYRKIAQIATAALHYQAYQTLLSATNQQSVFQARKQNSNHLYEYETIIIQMQNRKKTASNKLASSTS